MQNVTGYILFLILGFIPFSFINGLWAEVPIFIHETKEGNSIASLIAASYNVANIFPFLYVFLMSFVKISEKYSIIFFTLLGIVSCIVLGFFWKGSTHVFGKDISIALLVFSFTSGLVGCTLVLVLYAFASNYRRLFTSALSTGMGLSGIVSALLALAQNAGTHPRFSVAVYFSIIAFIMFLGLISFFVILWKQDNFKKPTENVGINAETPLVDVQQGSKKYYEKKEIILAAASPIINQLLTSGMVYFVQPGLLPYLTQSSQILLWMNNSYMVFNMLGRMATGAIHIWNCFLLNIFQGLLFGYMLLVAIIQHKNFPVTSWILVPVIILFALLNGYTTTMVYIVVDHKVEEIELSKKIRRWVALCNQIGSLSGSYLCLLLISLHAFQE